MVILDADHPDIREFVWCKAKEERKARVLAQAGFDMDLDGEDSHSTQYQNANNSVRVSDEFMQAVLGDDDWGLVARTNGQVLETIKARDLFRQISEAAWECADPGLQYDTTINKWHTAPNTGRISGSNPCFTADMLVHTDKGFVRFDALVDRVNQGEQFAVYTHDATNAEPVEKAVLSSPEAIMITGYNDIVRLRFHNGMELRCTPSHKIFTANRGYVAAEDLTPDDRVKVLDVPAPAVEADLALPVPTDPATYREAFGRNELLRFPEEWSEEFAHYLGWLVGDGSTSGNTTSTIYGSAEDRDEVLPRHAELLEWVNGDRPIKLSEQANGTAQLRLGRAPFKRFLESLGVKSVTGAYKQVPWAIEQAPAFAASAFLRGLFDADGCVRVDHAKGCYVGLGSISPELLRGVQRLLTTFGISSHIYQTRKDAHATGLSYTRKDGTSTTYASGPAYDLRIASGSIRRFAAEIGFSLSRKSALLDEVASGGQHGFYDVDRTVRLAERMAEGRELTYNLSEPRNHSYVVNGVVVRNCSEYVHLDNSSCNLASLNLLRFMEEGGHFDVAGFRAATEVVFTAQEILVGNADYPTEKIGDTTRKFRELGLGYANLGALLMSEGLPYDSEEGRAWAGAITALMTGAAYETSARTAARMGPFAGFHENSEPMLNVLRMHRAEVAKIDEEVVPTDLLSAAQEAWDHAVELAEQYGVRNSQSTVLAPTGTISFLMDCDTTGIEPDLGLVKTKKLVGGGTMSIVNQTVPRALRKLGYSDSEIVAIIAHIDEHKSIVGAPKLKAEHLPVFACSMGDNVIHYVGHVKMMAAAQPFVSGAISKTINMPEYATVEEVEQLHIDAWQMGLKAVAIYRDNCKVAQPLSTTKKDGAVAPSDSDPGVRDEFASTVFAAKEAELTARIAELEDALQHSHVTAPAATTRTRLPRRRRSNTFAFRVADCEGYVTVGEYEDGRPGEVFMKVSKQGSTLSGVMDAFSISVSLGLQHGVPLSTFVRKYTNMRFEPAGITDDSELRLASSLVDYIFRRLALDYLSFDERIELGVLSTHERTQPTLPGLEDVDAGDAGRRERERFGAGGDTADSASSEHRAGSQAGHPAGSRSTQFENRDAPFCYACGNVMQRAGSCYACPSCGTTSGCS
jgi:ribonucleoside-diphosphate reductase alpha chain